MRTILEIGCILGLFAFAAAAEPNQAEVREAVEKALPALQKAGPVFSSKSGCISCHHQTLPAQVTAMAKARGYKYDTAVQEQQLQAILGMVGPARELLLEGSHVVPQIPATGSHVLFALAAHQYPLDATTAAIVSAVGMQQQVDGSWPGWAPRPPISGGDIRETSLAVRALDIYAPPGRRKEFDARIERARKWLMNAEAKTPEEQIALLDGLVAAKAPANAVNRAAKAVLALQQADGGWAQLTTRESDAFATGEALVALHRAGAITVADPAYQRGYAYLLRTQEADGSWHVKTRAYPFQPLIETGYPHGRDQWISAAGTSYALMALMLADPARAQ